VITEGVETMDQVRLLRRLGCICIQGYVFSRPQPLASCLEQLRRDLSRTVEVVPKGQGQRDA
jgi:EAL domain-containing protein (putative c-di-GMP-specific phosphodiesterase class I)